MINTAQPLNYKNYPRPPYCKIAPIQDGGQISFIISTKQNLK